MTTDPSPPRFEEQAALDELERLHKELEASRQRRKDASEAFDSFVRSFADGSSSAQPAVSGRSGERSIPAPMPPQLPRPPAALVGSEHVSWTAPTRHAIRVPRLAVLGALALVFGGFLAWLAFRSGTTATAPTQPRAAAPAAEVTPAPTPTPPPAPAAPIQAELTTVRRVWVRVTVDGEKQIERELDANARIPVAAQRSVVVRAGDASALRIVVNGKDQGPLGREGEVRTWTYALPR